MKSEKLNQFKLNLMRAQQFCLINAIRDAHPELDRQAWCQKALELSLRGVHELSEQEQASLISHQRRFRDDLTVGDFHQVFQEFLQQMARNPGSQEYLDFLRRDRLADFQALMDDQTLQLYQKLKAQISFQIGHSAPPVEPDLEAKLADIESQILTPSQRQAKDQKLNTLKLARQTFGRLLPEQITEMSALKAELKVDVELQTQQAELQAQLSGIRAEMAQALIQHQDSAKLKLKEIIEFNKPALNDAHQLQTIAARVVELDFVRGHYAVDIEGLQEADYVILQNYGYTRSESPISRAIELVGENYYRKLILDQDPLKNGLGFNSSEAAHKSDLVLNLFRELRQLQQEEVVISQGDKKDKIRRFGQVYERARKLIARLALINHQDGGPVSANSTDASNTSDDYVLLESMPSSRSSPDATPIAKRFAKDEALHTALNQALAVIRIARGAHPSHILNFENLTMDITHGLGDYHQQKNKKVIFSSLELNRRALHAKEARDLMILMARHHEPQLEAWAEFEAAAPQIRESLRAQGKAPHKPYSVDLIQQLPPGRPPDDSVLARTILLMRALWRGIKDTPRIIKDINSEFIRDTKRRFTEYFKLINLNDKPQQVTQLEQHRRAFQAYIEANKVKIRYQGLAHVLSNTMTDVMLSAADYASEHPNKFGLAVVLSTLGGMGLLVPAQALFFQSLLTVLPGSNILIRDAVDALQKELSLDRAVETLSKALLGFEPELSVVAGGVLIKGLKTRSVGALLSQIDHRRINQEFIASCGALLSRDKNFNEIFSSETSPQEALKSSKLQGSVLRRILSIVPYGFKFVLDSFTHLLFLSAGVIIPILPLMSALWPLRARSPQMFIKLVARSWAALFLQALSRGILRPLETGCQAALEFVRDVYHFSSRILGTSLLIISLIAPLATLSSYLAQRLKGIKFLSNTGRLPVQARIARLADGLMALREGFKNSSSKLEYALFNEGTGFFKAFNGNRLAVRLKQNFDTWCHRLEDRAHTLQALSLAELSPKAEPSPDLGQLKRSNHYEMAGSLAQLVPQLENVQRQFADNHISGARPQAETEMRAETMNFKDCVAQMKQGLNQVPEFKRLKLDIREDEATVRAHKQKLIRINHDGSVSAKPTAQSSLSPLQRDLMVYLAPSEGCTLHGGDVVELIDLVQALRAKHPNMPINIDAAELKLIHINEPALHQQLQQLLSPADAIPHPSKRPMKAARPEPS